MIKKLNEDTSLKFKQLDQSEKESRGILGRLYGTVASFSAPTRNGRKYSQELWEKLFESDLIKERLANGGIFGELCHPDYEEVDMSKIAIVMPEAPVKDDSGKLVAYVDIIDTPCGKIAYQLAKYGYKFGISSRGTGELIEGVNGEEVDPDSYQLNAFDLVEIPAVESARLSFVESLDSNKLNLKKAITEDLDSANDSDKKIMLEALNSLNIKLDESSLENDAKEVMKDIISDANESLDEELDAAQKGTIRGEIAHTIHELMEEFGMDQLDPKTLRKEVLNAVDTIIKWEYNFDDAEEIEEELNTMEESDLDVWDHAEREIYKALTKVMEYAYFHTNNKVSQKDLIGICEEAIMRLADTDIDLEEECNDENRADITSNISEEVVNDKSEDMAEVTEQLQEALLKNKKLAQDNLSLQEKLSVRDAKDVKLKEELKKYKTALITVSNKVKNIKPMAEKLDIATKELTEKDNIIEAKTIELNLITESFNDNTSKLDLALNQVQQLKDELEAVKMQLTESVESEKLATNTIVKYKKALKEAREAVLKTKAAYYGVDTKSVLSNLNESYKLSDLDSVCQKLSEQKRTINKLPFRVTEDIKFNVIAGRDHLINDNINSDDEVSETLLNLIR